MRNGDICSAELSRHVSRREFQRALLATGLGVVTASVFSRSATAAAQAAYFTWSGYDVPELHQGYVAKHGVLPTFSNFADEEEALLKVATGYAPDLAHPCTLNLPSWREQGLIDPIDTSKIEHWEDIFPILLDIPGIKQDGQYWLMPFDWGQTSIIYRPDLVDIDEESWSLLWDKRYEGRMAVINVLSEIVLAAALHGGIEDPFNMSEADLDRIADLLRQQRPLLRQYADSATDIEQGLASGELVAGMAWNASVMGLRKQGVPVRFMNPKEGRLTWVCGVVMVKGGTQREKAYDVLNAMLDPSAGRYLIESYGYGHANALSFQMASEQRIQEAGLSTEPESLLTAGTFHAPMQNKTELARMLGEIQAGF